ncbi:hypothetical protein [Bacillus sp. PK3_68]|uniref:hypothetical protein n=1 Tax=Bacillus sp. PK3_68 TaxID=2027408 RepID=UPI001603ED84|nr:hypothetical protein [Bacillus sp. PK3_68]
MAEPQRFPFGYRNSRPFWERRMDDNEFRQAEVENSGNSDVDIHVIVEMDTKPVAYAMLCSLLATKQINYKEFEDALKILDGLLKKDEKDRVESKDRGASKVKLFHPTIRKDDRYE